MSNVYLIWDDRRIEKATFDPEKGLLYKGILFKTYQYLLEYYGEDHELIVYHHDYKVRQLLIKKGFKTRFENGTRQVVSVSLPNEFYIELLMSLQSHREKIGFDINISQFIRKLLEEGVSEND